MGLKQALHESRVARARDCAEYVGCDMNIDAYASMSVSELDVKISNIKSTLYPHPEYAEFMMSNENPNTLLTYFTKSSYDAVQQLIPKLEELYEKKKSERENQRNAGLGWGGGWQ